MQKKVLICIAIFCVLLQCISANASLCPMVSQGGVESSEETAIEFDQDSQMAMMSDHCKDKAEGKSVKPCCDFYGGCQQGHCTQFALITSPEAILIKVTTRSHPIDQSSAFSNPDKTLPYRPPAV